MVNLLKKILRYAALTVLGLFLAANLFVILSGRFYLYNGVWNTYLKGRSGPSIYDLEVFHTSTIEKSGTPHSFVINDEYNKIQLSEKDLKYLEGLDTKAFLVLRGDTLLYEAYWDEHDKKQVSNSFSMAKTVVAMLIGIAIDEGHIGKLDDPVGKYLPEFKEGKKANITIRHLLIMASGLDWTESGKDPLSNNAESYYGSNLRSLVLNQKVEDEPGLLFNYQSGNSQLLAFILEKATGKDLSAYADEKIWKPLGCSSDAYWSLDSKEGDEKAFCCLYATPRDFAKLGQVFINKGKYRGKQIIPKWYYYEMVRPYPMETKEGIANQRYGLHIWTYFGGENPAYYFRGISGQYIITIPEENLVIVRIGTGTKPVFRIPYDKEADADFVAENYHKVGHHLGLFEYISLGKKIAGKSE
jgi:CubicO group peptidase (beta-lactamase class C family)